MCADILFVLFAEIKKHMWKQKFYQATVSFFSKTVSLGHFANKYSEKNFA